MSALLRFAMLLSLGLLAGCGFAPGPVATIEEVVPVSGTLTYQGKPLEGYQVTFLPTDGRRVAVGVTDSAGHFTLGTNTLNDGAPPGSHKVSVVWAGPPSTDGAVLDAPTQPPKPPVQIPTKYGNPESSGLTQEVPPEGLRDLKIDLN